MFPHTIMKDRIYLGAFLIACGVGIVMCNMEELEAAPPTAEGTEEYCTDRHLELRLEAYRSCVQDNGRSSQGCTEHAKELIPCPHQPAP